MSDYCSGVRFEFVYIRRCSYKLQAVNTDDYTLL